MKIGQDVYRSPYTENNVNTHIKETESTKASDSTAGPQKGDSVEISSAAYRLKADADNISASAGKDTLPVTRGSKDGSFVVHFTDSAMVNRAVSRGYITVNGVDVTLSDGDKKKLLETDRDAQAKREAAFAKYVSEHEMAVAKQQGEALSAAQKEMSKAIEIAAKVTSGKKVSQADMQLLLKADPKLYAMAMAAKVVKKDDGPDGVENSGAADDQAKANAGGRGVSWDDFQWKTYETQMDVSPDGEPAVGDVSQNEVVLNPGK